MVACKKEDFQEPDSKKDAGYETTEISVDRLMVVLWALDVFKGAAESAIENTLKDQIVDWGHAGFGESVDYCCEAVDCCCVP